MPTNASSRRCLRRSPPTWPRASSGGVRPPPRVGLRAARAGSSAPARLRRADEVEDVGVVERAAAVDLGSPGKLIDGLSGDRRERNFGGVRTRAAARCRTACHGRGRARCRSPRGPVTPVKHCGSGRTVEAGGGSTPGFGPGTARCAAGCRSARRSCTGARRRCPVSTGPRPMGRAGPGCRRRRSAARPARPVALELDLDALGLERGQLRRRVGAGRCARLELAVNHAVRPVADDRELVADRGVHRRRRSRDRPRA